MRLTVVKSRQPLALIVPLFLTIACSDAPSGTTPDIEVVRA